MYRKVSGRQVSLCPELHYVKVAEEPHLERPQKKESIGLFLRRDNSTQRFPIFFFLSSFFFGSIDREGKHLEGKVSAYHPSIPELSQKV